MYDGRAIANIILDHTNANGIEISNLSLQKILFFCHSWFLVMTGAPLVRQYFEAWELGPVLPDVYRQLKGAGHKTITSHAKRLDIVSGAAVTATCEIGAEELATLTKIIDFYSRMTPTQLVGLSHVTDGPWWRTWNHEGKAKPGMRIDNDLILDYYSNLRGPIQ